MKKIKILVGLLFATQFSTAQFTTIWPATTVSNSTSAGFVGIGTKPTATPRLYLRLIFTCTVL